MGLWRATPEDAPEKTSAAIDAARETIERTTVLGNSEAWSHRESHPWQCRVALNTGEALMGTLGSKGARDFTVLGDTVNVAFRLESVGAQKEVDLIFSKATAEYLGEGYQPKSLGSVIVEGRTENIEVFTLP